MLALLLPDEDGLALEGKAVLADAIGGDAALNKLLSVGLRLDLRQRRGHGGLQAGLVIGIVHLELDDEGEILGYYVVGIKVKKNKVVLVPDYLDPKIV